MTIMIRRSFLGILSAVLPAPARLFAKPGPRCEECGRRAAHLVIDREFAGRDDRGVTRWAETGRRLLCEAHARPCIEHERAARRDGGAGWWRYSRHATLKLDRPTRARLALY